MPIHDVAGDFPLLVPIPSATAAAATATVALLVVPFRCQVVGASFAASAGVTGVDTNSRSLNVKDSGGNIRASVAFVGGVNVAALALAPMTVQPPPNVDIGWPVLPEGAVLAIESQLVGTGLALPFGTVRVRVQGA